MRMSGVMIFVRDFDRMAAFYGHTLKLKPVAASRTESWVEFETGGTRLALHAIPPDIAAKIEVAQPPSPRANNPTKLIFEVDDLEFERKSLESKGVTILERPWGVCDAVNPEGNIFQIRASTNATK